MKRREAVAGPPDLKPETVAVLLAGWGAEPPASVPQGPRGFDGNFLTLYDAGGIARLWREHETWLRAQAAEWNWSPAFTLDDRMLFYGEYVAASGQER
jgi:hypothetical protein